MRDLYMKKAEVFYSSPRSTLPPINIHHTLTTPTPTRVSLLTEHTPLLGLPAGVQHCDEVDVPGPGRDDRAALPRQGRRGGSHAHCGQQVWYPPSINNQSSSNSPSYPLRINTHQEQKTKQTAPLCDDTNNDSSTQTCQKTGRPRMQKGQATRRRSRTVASWRPVPRTASTSTRPSRRS